MRRTLSKALTLVMAVALALAVTACGEDPQAQITEKINSDFEQAEGLNTETIDSLVGEDLSDELAAYGASSTEVYQAFYQHFDYSIESVEVTGETAVATIRCSNVDFATIVPQWMEELIAWAASDEAATLYAEQGEEAVNAKAMGLLLDKMKAADAPTVSGTVEVNLQKTDDGWYYTDDEELAQVFMAGQNYEELVGSLESTEE